MYCTEWCTAQSAVLYLVVYCHRVKYAVYSTTQPSTAKYSIAQHSTVQHSALCTAVGEVASWIKHCLTIHTVAALHCNCTFLYCTVAVLQCSGVQGPAEFLAGKDYAEEPHPLG